MARTQPDDVRCSVCKTQYRPVVNIVTNNIIWKPACEHDQKDAEFLETGGSEYRRAYGATT